MRVRPGAARSDEIEASRLQSMRVQKRQARVYLSLARIFFWFCTMVFKVA
jgi:hypothetical protein